MIYIYTAHGAILTLTLYNHRHLDQITTGDLGIALPLYGGNLIPSMREAGPTRVNRSLSLSRSRWYVISHELGVKWDTKNCKTQTINPISIFLSLVISKIMYCLYRSLFILSYKSFAKYTPFHVVCRIILISRRVIIRQKKMSDVICRKRECLLQKLWNNGVKPGSRIINSLSAVL